MALALFAPTGPYGREKLTCWPCCVILNHWPLDKMAGKLQTITLGAISSMELISFDKFSLKFVSRCDWWKVIICLDWLGAEQRGLDLWATLMTPHRFIELHYGLFLYHDAITRINVDQLIKWQSKISMKAFVVLHITMQIIGASILGLFIFKWEIVWLIKAWPKWETLCRRFFLLHFNVI